MVVIVSAVRRAARGAAAAAAHRAAPPLPRWTRHVRATLAPRTPAEELPDEDAGGGLKAVFPALASTPEAAVAALQLRTQRLPRPASHALKPTDVVVAVRAAAVNWVDLLMAAGQYQHQPPFPYVPGMEYSGRVAWAGAAVAGLRVGDAVFSDVFAAGPRSGGDYQRWGGFASYAVAPEGALRPVPRGFDWAQAATWCGAFETAWHGLAHCGGLQRGETVLVLGATGSCGLAAVQIASALGANVVAAGGAADKLRRAAAEARGDGQVLGTVDYTAQPRFRDAVREIVGERGVDVVFDTVGGGATAEALRCVRFGARLVVIGWTSTPFAAGGRGARDAGAPAQPANAIPTNLLMMKGVTAVGSPVVIATQHDAGGRLRAARLTALDALAADGLLRPLVSDAFPLERAKEALLAKWNRKITGSAVVVPPGAEDDVL